jgi:6-phosphogluconolactonase (cycloisomerase 2 family)
VAPTGPSGNGNSNEYLFATSGSQVFSFNINTTTGALSSGTSVSGPQLSEGIVANPAGTFLYVSDAYNDQVDVYSISASGTLSTISTSPYTVGSAPTNNTSLLTATGLAMDPLGKYLYATDFNNNAVAAFTVNSSTGALTPITNSPFPAGTQPQNVIVDPTGSFAYVTDFGDFSGGIFSFTLSGGAPTAIPGYSPFDTVLRGTPAGMATTAGYLYLTEQAVGEVDGLAIGGNGALSLVPSSPISTGGTRPTGVVIATTTSGKYLYVANAGTGNAATPSSIAAYSINSSTGELTPLANSPFATTVSPFYLAVDPSGSFLYATNPNDNTITGFTINASTGALVQLSGSATPAGTLPVSLTTATIP